MLSFTRFGNRAYISHEYDYLKFEKKHDVKDIRSFDELRKEIQENTSLQSTFRKKFRNSKKVWIKGAIKYLSLIIHSKYRENYANYGKTFFKVITLSLKYCPSLLFDIKISAFAAKCITASIFFGNIFTLSIFRISFFMNWIFFNENKFFMFPIDKSSITMIL